MNTISGILPENTVISLRSRMSLLSFVPNEMEKLGERKHAENEANDQAQEKEYFNGGEKWQSLIH